MLHQLVKSDEQNKAYNHYSNEALWLNDQEYADDLQNTQQALVHLRVYATSENQRLFDLV